MPVAVSDAGTNGEAGTAAGEAAGDCCTTPGLKVVVMNWEGLAGLRVGADGEANWEPVSTTALNGDPGVVTGLNRGVVTGLKR